MTKFDFFKWCLEQDGERFIDHTSWSSCAYGEWLVEGCEEELVEGWCTIAPQVVLDDLGLVEGEDEVFTCQVFTHLNLAGCSSTTKHLDTYTELQQLILDTYGEPDTWPSQES